MANLENTQYFNVKTDPAVRVKEVLDLVYNAMAEKGYNPVNQIVDILCQATRHILPAIKVPEAQL